MQNKEDHLTEEEYEQSSGPLDRMGDFVQTSYSKAVEHKETTGVSDDLERCLAQYRGQYYGEEECYLEDNDVYRNITSLIVRTVIAWLKDAYFFAEDRPWAIEPTPIPELPEYLAKELEDAQLEILLQAGYPNKEADRLLEKLSFIASDMAMEKATRASELMTKKIDDQLTEGQWRDSFHKIMSDIAIFPAAVLKAPVIRLVRELKWDGNELVQDRTPKMVVERVSPFDIFLSADSENTQDGEFIIERIRMTRARLLESRELPNFSRRGINLALSKFKKGTMNQQGAGGSAGINSAGNDDYSRYDNEGVDRSNRHSGSMIEVLNFWGRVSGDKILEFFELEAESNEAMRLEDGSVQAGDFGDIDPFEEYEMNIWVINGIVIKAVKNPHPLSERPYHMTSYSKIPGSPWGEGVCQILYDGQREINAAARARVRNMGFASGPMIEVNVDRLEGEDRPNEIEPWSVMYTKSGAVGASGDNRPAVNYHQAPSNSNELTSIMQEVWDKMHDLAGVPPYTYGNNQGAARTLGAFSMQYANAAKGIKAVIGNIDRELIEPMIETFYYLNMKYDEDEAIKVDAKIKARGAAGIMAQEQRQSRPIETLQAAGPFLPPEAAQALTADFLKQSGYDPENFGLSGGSTDRDLANLSNSGRGQQNINPGAVQTDGRSGNVSAPDAANIPQPI